MSFLFLSFYVLAVIFCIHGLPHKTPRLSEFIYDVHPSSTVFIKQFIKK